jgi:hypothetical protein
LPADPSEEGQGQRSNFADHNITLKAAQKFVYRAAGVPVIVRRAFAPAPKDALAIVRDAYARHYFHTVSQADRRRVRRALLTWPIVLAVQMVRFTRRNGPTISKRHGRPIVLQLFDQLRFYFRLGILPRWYYIFSLYEADVAKQAHCFLNRFETKLATFRLLNWPGSSPLNDKAAFATHCSKHGIPTVAPVAAVQRGQVIWSSEERLPQKDLFVKPIAARGGKGAERWDHAGNGRYRNMDGELVSGEALLGRFMDESDENPRLIQLRAVNHPGIADLSNGALCTARVMTCLDEQDQPEVVASVFRMAVGRNVTVDNIHAGGVAAEVNLQTGELGPASNLGDDARLGWLDIHPDTGGRIQGRPLPMWKEVKALATQAHRAFADRTVVGWDIAITADGPRLVEGNSGPDVDLLQRPMRRGLGCGRLGELMAFHLSRRGWGRAN